MSDKVKLNDKLKIPMKTVVIFLLMLIHYEMVFSQTNVKQQNTMEIDITDDNKQVLELTRQLTQFMIDRNTKEMNKILDANFTLTHMTGYVQPKEEWFSEIETERMKYYSYKEANTSVKIEGNKATAITQINIDARIWGSRNNWRLQQTMQLEKRNSKWIILKSVATTF